MTDYEGVNSDRTVEIRVIATIVSDLETARDRQARIAAALEHIPGMAFTVTVEDSNTEREGHSQEALQRWLDTGVREAWRAAHPNDSRRTPNALAQGGIHSFRDLFIVGYEGILRTDGISGHSAKKVADLVEDNLFGLELFRHPNPEKIAQYYCTNIDQVPVAILPYGGYLYDKVLGEILSMPADELGALLKRRLSYPRFYSKQPMEYFVTEAESIINTARSFANRFEAARRNRK